MDSQARNKYPRRKPDSFGSPYGAQPGYGGGYGAGGYSYTTPSAVIREPWAVTQWTEYYVPTVQAGGRRPVIYVAAPLPAGGLGGFGGGLGGLGGGLGGLGGGLGGGLPFIG